MHTTRILLACAPALGLAPALALAQIQLPAGHVDFGVGFADGAPELHWHDEGNAAEYAPHEAYAFVPLSSSATRPAGSQWDFTGAAAGGTLYLAPATQTAGVIFLGLGTEEIDPGTFVGDSITLRLDSVSGPGAFSLWQTDGFGSPLVALSTTSDIDSFSLTTGGHDHYNWGFATPGIYELIFTVSGTLAADSSPVSDTATFTFAVGATPVPEPSAFAALGGLAALGFAATRRRRVPARG